MIKRMSLVLGVACLIATAAVPIAEARWGCMARGGSAWGRNWDMDSRAEAEKSAMEGCNDERKAGYPACKIVACYPDVDTREEAHKVFPATGCSNCK